MAHALTSGRPEVTAGTTVLTGPVPCALSTATATAADADADAVVFDGGADKGVSSADDVKVLPLTATELAASWDLGSGGGASAVVATHLATPLGDK